VEISNEQAGRQPQAQWKEAHDRVNNNYLVRLKAGNAGRAA
jgi:hypothetical protein